MITKFDVEYRELKTMRSGIVKIVTRRMRFDTLGEAKVFAAEHSEPIGSIHPYPYIEKMEIDNELLASVFSLPCDRRRSGKG